MKTHLYDSAELSKWTVVNISGDVINLLTEDGNVILNSFPPHKQGPITNYGTTTLAGLPVRGAKGNATLPTYKSGQITIVSSTTANRIRQGNWKYPGIVLVPDTTAFVKHCETPASEPIYGYYRFEVLQSDGDATGALAGESPADPL